MRQKMIGSRFGRLTVLEEVKKPGNPKKFWLCQCDCGNTHVAEDSHLKNGHTKSCGCYRKDKIRAREIDLTGHRYGRLTVLGPASDGTDSRNMWKCQCDCGEICVCQKGNLRSGITKSCGCLREEQRKENMKKAIHFVDGTCVERIASRKTFSSNTTGHRGVYRRKNARWRASIGFKGKVYNLGTYIHFEDAVQARLDAEERLYDSFLQSIGANGGGPGEHAPEPYVGGTDQERIQERWERS